MIMRMNFRWIWAKWNNLLITLLCGGCMEVSTLDLWLLGVIEKDGLVKRKTKKQFGKLIDFYNKIIEN